jgi:hypothetical protein
VSTIDEKIRDELKALKDDGVALLVPYAEYQKAQQKGQSPALPQLQYWDYEAWYTKALAAVQQLAPDRTADFIDHYKLSKPSKSIDYATYRISNALIGLSSSSMNAVSTMNAVAMHLGGQVNIVASLSSRLDSTLANLRASLQAILLDNELEAAAELAKAKHLRSAGTIAGVVLERHLREVCERHTLSLKKRATLSDLYELLKNAGVIDVPVWRSLQHFSDIRNLCAHNADREPTRDEVDTLISGVIKIIKTVH